VLSLGVSLAILGDCHDVSADNAVSTVWEPSEVTSDVEHGECPGKDLSSTVALPSWHCGRFWLESSAAVQHEAWKGEYHLLDNPVHKLDNRRRVELHKKYIGFVFQQYHLLDNLTVAENLDLPLSYRDIKKTEREGMVADALDRFQIVGKKALFPNQLSGGQQQLVAVARAVIGKPKLILADEPTGSLHSSQGKMIMDMLKKLNDDGTTIIQVTHNNEWAAYGNRIIQLADGWIVDGQPVAGGATASR
jgi:ABC-type lipoprotein export system ATPase subunit